MREAEGLIRMGGAWKRGALVCAAALGIRLVFVLGYPQVGLERTDAGMYDQVGANLASGKGFVGGFAGQFAPGGEGPEVGIGPVYPVFLASIYAVFGHNLTAVRIAQAVLGAAAIWLLYPVMVRAFGPFAAALAGWGMAVYPALVVYTGMLLTETLCIFFLALLTASVWGATQRGTLRWWGAAGVVLGATILLRQEMLVSLPALAALALWRRASGGRGWARAAVFSLAALLTVGVWTLRNYVVFHRVILGSAHGGEILWISTTDWTEWHYDDPELQALIAGRDYLDQEQVLAAEGIRRIRRDPWGYLRLCLGRLHHFWLTSHTTYLRGFSETYRHYANAGQYGRVGVKLALLALNTLVILAGFFGVWQAALHRRETMPAWILLLIPIVVIAAVHVPLFASPRYQVPLVPFLLAFAASLPRRRCG